MSPASMPLERYAAMRAEMEAGVGRDDVLARAGVGADEWADVQRGWLEKMGAELERGRFEVTSRYTQAFLARQQELEAPAVVLASTPVVVSPPVAVAPSATPPVLPAPSTLSFPSSTLQTPISISAVAPPLVVNPAQSFEATGSIDPAIIRAALPFARDPAPSRPTPSAPEPSPLPFRSAGASPSPVIVEVPSAPPRPLVAKLPAELHTTGSIDPAIIRAALPFARDAAPAALKPVAPSPEPGVPAPARREPPVGGSTGELPADLIDRITKGSLPFPANPAASAPRAPSAPSASTKMVPHSAEATIPTLASGPKADGTPSLTIEQYAALCVELAATPQQTDAVFLRYGLTTARERSEVDRSWRERLERDPAEYRSWQELYQRYKVYWVDKACRPPGR